MIGVSPDLSVRPKTIESPKHNFLANFLYEAIKKSFQAFFFYTCSVLFFVRINKMESSAEVKTPPSRHYFYRKATQQQQPISPNIIVDGLESANAFENRIHEFINKDALQSSIHKLRQDATADLNRRKADRKARKEKENNNVVVEHITPPVYDVLFEKLSALSTSEQNAWLANIHDDAMLMNPHQWLKLANLFNVNSKASRQQSLLNLEMLDIVLKDRGIDKEEIKPLESFLELRDIQNRNYARDA